jgi:hypothetical protein
MALHETFLRSSSRIASSFPVSLVAVESRPFGRPRWTPSDFLRARASFVRDHGPFDLSREGKGKGQDFSINSIAEFIAFFDREHLHILFHQLVQDAHHLHQTSTQP